MTTVERTSGALLCQRGRIEISYVEISKKVFCRRKFDSRLAGMRRVGDVRIRG